MLFLQSAMLWGLLAAAIPIIIHLLNRRRHRTIQWAAMQFLLKATRESRGKKRLRHILILACRALGIAALATAAAVPVVSGLFGFGAGKPDLVVLVLDRSASMEANPLGGTTPRRELALQRVRDAFADLGGTRLVLIDSANATPQEVPSPGSLAELAATAATDTRADLPALLATATEFLAETPGRSEVWLASDLQSSNWLPESERWTAIRAALTTLPQKPRVRVLALGGEPAANQSLRIHSSRRSGSSLILEVELARGDDSTSPLNLPLTLSLNGSRTTENLTLGGQRLRFQKAIALPESEEYGHGWLSIPGDGNPRDNVAFFAFGPSLPVSSRVVAPPGEAAEYLTLAAAPGGFGGQTSERIDPAASLDTNGQAAILWAAPLPEGPAADELERFLNDGGQVVFFAPEADSDASFLDINWSPVTTAGADTFFILDSWDHDDGLLRDGIDGTPLPADRLRALNRRIPEGDFATLARWDDTQPFLARRVVGRGTAWFLGSIPDYRWSNLGDADVLLPAIQRAILKGADRFDSGYLTELGSTDAVLKPGETRTRIDDFDAATRSDPAHLAGIYRSDGRTLALNRPALEDLPDLVERSTLNALLEGTGFTFFEDTSQSSLQSISRGIWRGFLIAMLCFLIAEALLCLPKRGTVAAATGQTAVP